MQRILISLLCLGVACSALAAKRKNKRSPPPPLRDSPVTLVHLVDADTAYFRTEGGEVFQARFAGVNAPECHKRQVKLRSGLRSARCARDDEPHGLAAAHLALKLLRAGPIRATCERKRDGTCKAGGYGRALVYLRAGGVDVAERLIAEGLSWTYTKYPSARRARYCAAEAKARAEGRGMWARPVQEVMARVHKKTRRWYQQHDALCQRARSTAGRRGAKRRR